MPVHWESRSEPFPGYRLLERLGRGGFGEVWKAEAPGGLTKAIKFVSGTISGERGRNHAEQEHKALARVRDVRHPFILSTERVEVVDGQLVIVMELADRNLDERFRECRRQGLPGIPRAELLKYLAEAAEALDLMNLEHDLQHLDIKPQNLFLVGGHVKVADFGLVKDLEGHEAQMTGGVTPVYAAPETFDGWVSRATDQYSLAVVYMELLTGHRPFPGPSARQFMMQHCNAEPDLTPLPEVDRAAVAQALSKDPTKRFPSCLDFLRRLANGPITADAARVIVSEAPGVAPAEPDGHSRAEPVEASVSTRLTVRGSDSTGPVNLRPRPVLDRALIPVDALSDRGLLCPTLFIGLGRTGQRCLERVRQKLRQRFGDSASWPAIRLLGIDVDADVLRELEKTEPVARESHDQLLVLKLRKPNQYFKAWEGLRHLSSWLNPNALFCIGASGTTNGYRSLGRLALIDNYRRVLARLRGELSELLSPTAIESARSATGLDFRRDAPRIFVAAAMGGGTGSGVWIDLCYLARRVLLEAGVSRPDVEGLLIAGYDSGAKDADLRRVNHYAFAQNLLELTQPEVDFQVEYETDGERDRFTAPPIESLYFFDQAAPHLPEPREQTVLDAVAEFCVDSATGRVGKALDEYAALHQWPMFRGVGWFSIHYPRRSLLRHTAAALCQTMVRGWIEPLPAKIGDPIGRAAEHSLVSMGFDPPAITERLLEAINGFLSEPLHVLTGRLVADLERDLTSQDPAQWGGAVQEAVARLKAILGLDPGEERADLDDAPLLDRLLCDATNRVAAALYQPLLDQLRAALEVPGRRVAQAKKTLDGFAAYLLHRVDEQQEQARAAQAVVARRAREVRDRPGSLALTRAHHLEGLVHLLDQYAREKMECRLREQTVQVYLVLRARLSDAGRDLVSIRQEIERLLAEIGVALDEPDNSGGFCCQTLFPGGELALTNAAEPIYRRLAGTALGDLEDRLGETLFAPMGGLWAACKSSDTIASGLKNALLHATMNWIDESLPAADAADALFDRHGDDADGRRRELAAFLDWAAPSAQGRQAARGGGDAPREFAVVAIPDSEAGQSLLEGVRQARPDLPVASAKGGEECIFCRVSGHSNLARILPGWLVESRRLYEQSLHGRLSPEIFPQVAHK